MFKEMIEKTMKIYIDDMLVKSLKLGDHVTHLVCHMMLNPSKCIFGVSSRKILSFLVTKRGNEANPDQIKALLAMSLPRNVCEVQQLSRQVAALNKFVSKSMGKCLSFFKILRTRPLSG